MMYIWSSTPQVHQVIVKRAACDQSLAVQRFGALLPVHSIRYRFVLVKHGRRVPRPNCLVRGNPVHSSIEIQYLETAVHAS